MRIETKSHAGESTEPIRRSLRAADLLLALWFLLCSGAVLPLLMVGDGSDEGAAQLRLFLLPNLVAAPLLTLARAAAIRNLLLRHPALAALMVWVWMSVLWSVDPGVTARRALSLSANTMIACFVVVYFRPDEIIRTLRNVMIGLILLSLAFAVSLPGLAFMPEFGEFRGVFTHKNGMGALLVWTSLVLAVSARSGLLSPLGTVAGFALIIALIFPTGSATALMLITLLAGLQIPISVAKLPSRLAVGVQSIVLLGGLVFVLPLLVARNRIFMALGRDPTINGRTQLWAFVRSMIDQRPFQGYGYQTFFELPGVAEHVLSLVGWPAPNAHNGYLEVWLGLGLVGLVLLLSFLIVALVRAWRCMTRDPKSSTAIFAFLGLSLYLSRNFSELDLLDQVGLSWIIALLGALMTSVRPLDAGADSVVFELAEPCPSSDDLRHVAGSQEGRLWIIWVEIMRPAGDAASDGLRWSGA